MLKRFRVNNFKSLLNTEFHPVGVNTLVGPNNAGKTNLCSAIRFLGLTASLSLEEALRNAIGETWNVLNVYVTHDTAEFEIDCTLLHEGEPIDYHYELYLRIAGQRKTGGFSVEKERLIASGAGWDQTVILETVADIARILDERHLKSENITHPRNTTLVCQAFESGRNQRLILFKRYLQSWAYFCFNPASLRSASVIRQSAGLASDGGNLSRTFFVVHNEKPRLEKQIIEIIKEIEPRLDLFTYASPNPSIVQLSLEDNKGNQFSAQSLSDGTLRFMAMTYLILAAAEMQGTGVPMPLYMIEEPENGLYVGHLKPLIQRIDPSGRAGQFIFTTHSPYFIDLFDSNLDGLHCLKPGIPSSVLTQPDVDRIRKLLNDMPLGEMHFREMLG